MTAGRLLSSTAMSRDLGLRLSLTPSGVLNCHLIEKGGRLPKQGRCLNSTTKSKDLGLSWTDEDVGENELSLTPSGVLDNALLIQRVCRQIGVAIRGGAAVQILGAHPVFRIMF